ncbi:MarR family transcriptional regulator [Photorhabdus noenieputensis]|uniref:MarR family transcriptional regulator n=1 Tax=Photorhabdus noenieputensis TaxID=1208607 RepID=UPI001BD68910|nr:MarR family transcriptional regulator [Photorhabdus noenieputensis]MBS9436144.1 MarR family transcriptional regulator [Photorhabdus noenieputensis]MCK3669181.1 MarR family transcriptional regulator [Photorhabdus noenieputensis]
MTTDNQDTCDTTVTPFEDALSRLQCVLVARRAITNPEGISWAEYDTLHLLRQYQSMNPTAIGEKLGFTRSKMSKILRLLKDNEFIKQETGENDKRELVTKLSPKGLMFLQRVESNRHNMADIVESNMSQSEIAIFTELCHRAADLLYAQTLINDED